MTMPLPTCALSVRQPFAWAIIYGGKDVENRNWQPRNPGLRFRGRIFIHAASGMRREEYIWGEEYIMPRSGRLPPPEELPRGGLIGMVTVVDSVTTSASPWFHGPYGLVLADPEPIPFIPCKGALGFFRVPPELLNRDKLFNNNEL